ncbi:hypothetical protein BH18GEM1_BH18GEM1_06840 [soil metagenome]
MAARVPVIPLVVDINPDLNAELERRYGTTYELVEIPERRLVSYQREILDMAHGRALWSVAAQERWRLRDREATNSLARVKRWTKKTIALPLANTSVIELLSRMERLSSRVLRTTESYLDLFRQIRPALVFNTSHVHSRNSIQAVQAASWLRIPTVAFVFSWDNLTSQGRVIVPYDHYLVWNEQIAAQLREIYPRIPPNRVHITGTPQFDFHFRSELYWSREKFCALVGADPARPIVVYTTGMPNHMPGEPAIVEDIADRLLHLEDLGPPQLLVRVYPKDRSGRFEEMRLRRRDVLFPEIPWVSRWHTPLPEDMALFTNTLRHAAIGMNVASTVSLELAMFNRPVINIAYNPPGLAPEEIDYARYYQFDHYRPVAESGAVEIARSGDQLEAMVRNALERPEEGTRDRRALLQQMFGDTLDGRSAERVACRLLEIHRQATEPGHRPVD